RAAPWHDLPPLAKGPFLFTPSNGAADRGERRETAGGKQQSSQLRAGKRAGGASVTLNCGYGHGFSVREVVEMVKRVSGVDFKVEIAPRRPGDPAQIVAASDRARAMLGWNPQYDDLATIIAHALGWDQRLRSGPFVRGSACR